MIKIYKYGEVSNEEVFARDNIASNVEPAVTAIIADVRSRGDEALFEYTARFDKAQLTSLEVSPAEIDEAFETVEPQFLDILREAAANIRLFHEKQVRNSFVINRDGVVMGQKVTPIERVGLYVPGGTAAYPSTVLMDAIPAKIAGCEQIVITQVLLDSVVDAVQVLLASLAAAQTDQTEDATASIPCTIDIRLIIHRLHINSRLHDIHIKITVHLHTAANIIAEFVLKLALIGTLQDNFA